MREIKTKKYKGSLILKFAILCFAAFLIVSLFMQRAQIGEKKAELEALQNNLKTQQTINAELQYTLENEVDIEDYAEKAARKDFNYAKPQEKIFVNVGGSD